MTKARATGTTGGAKGAIVVGTGSTTAAPLTVGTDGQFLTAASTASTGLTWSSVSIPSAVALQEQIFTSSGTWTAPTGVTKVWLLVVGGGGGGNQSGGQGMGGAQTQQQLTVSPGNVYTVTVGAGGPLNGYDGYSYNADGNASSFSTVTGLGGLLGRNGPGNVAGNNSYGLGGAVFQSANANTGGGGSSGYGGSNGGNGGSGIVIVRWLA
jgi:hypothetical protein